MSFKFPNFHKPFSLDKIGVGASSRPFGERESRFLTNFAVSEAELLGAAKLVKNHEKTLHKSKDLQNIFSFRLGEL